jgi:hypothetical protein
MGCIREECFNKTILEEYPNIETDGQYGFVLFQTIPRVCKVHFVWFLRGKFRFLKESDFDVLEEFLYNQPKLDHEKQRNIQFIVSMANVSEEKAAETLEIHNGDPVEAILSLTGVS